LLTATPGNVPQQSVATVCRFFCRILIHVMDREFLGRMVEFERGLSHAQ
jgi:hypothetical protein